MSVRTPRVWMHGAIAAALFTVGCASPVVMPPAAQFAISADEALQALATPSVHQWSTGLVTNEEIQRRKVEHLPAEPDRTVQTVTPNWSEASAGFDGSGATGRISSAPSYHYYTKACYWLTETGWLLKYNTKTLAADAFFVGGTDTFPNAAITLSNDGKRAYFVSAQGKFYAINTDTGSHVTGSPIAMGGTNANVGHGTMPFIDPLASRTDGSAETIYTTTATGVLYRMVVTAGKNPAQLTLAQTYNLPVVNTPSHIELVKSSPIVLGGRVVLTTWRRSTATPYNMANDEGALIYYNTNVRTTTTTTSTGATIRRWDFAHPIWAPAAVDVDNALVPTLAFFTAGTGLMMVDMLTGDYTQSVPLVVDNKTPVSGALASYPYSATGVTTVTKYPKANGAAMIYQDNTVNTTNMYAAKQVSSTNTNQVYGYTKFQLQDTDVTASNLLKVVTDARLELTCVGSSNFLNLYNPEPMRAFVVHNQLALGTGAAWDSTNLTFANRPSHVDGTAFDQTTATLAARSSWELSPNTRRSYLSGSTYAWPAKGKIASPNQDYSVGLVHTQLYETPSLLGGLLGSAAPKFMGGTSSASRPRLVLSLSAAGMASPTLKTAVTIDATNKQVFVASANALFKVSYAGASWVSRAANFGDDDQTHFALTRLGLDTDAPGSAGPLSTASTRFVENVTAPMFDGRYVYVQDNHPGYARTSLSRFTPGAPGVAPSLSSSLLLSDAGSDARASTPYLTYDYESNRLMIATYNPATNAGRAWIVNRF